MKLRTRLPMLQARGTLQASRSPPWPLMLSGDVQHHNYSRNKLLLVRQECFLVAQPSAETQPNLLYVTLFTSLLLDDMQTGGA